MFSTAMGRTRRINVMILMVTMLLSINVGGFDTGAAPYLAAIAQVAPKVETDPVPSGNDAADDTAVWIHPTDPGRSRIIGVDKAFNGGLLVYDLAGNQLQYLNEGGLNNVDIRYNFPLNGQPTDLIVASNQKYKSISIYRIRSDGFVENVSINGLTGIPTGMDVYGACMYHSPFTGKYYVYITESPYLTSDPPRLQQWELFDAGSGKVNAALRRTIVVGVEAEGCVADDVTGALYVAETRRGIRKFEAEPDAATTGPLVISLPSGESELEGVTLYYAGSDRGYLIVAGQSTRTFFVYRRERNNEYVTSFQIGAGNGIDLVNGTDGIDVTNVPLGSAFPQGAFLAHDHINTDDRVTKNSNYKLVPWESIANGAAPALAIDTRWNPRSSSAPSPPPTIVSSSRTFNATADARVEEGAPDTNYGGDIELRARGGSTDPDIRSYVRFAVSGVTRNVQHAKLRLYATSNTSNGPALYSTSNHWSESTITWQQAPARSGGAIDDKGAVAAGTWVEYDVTSVVKGEGTYNFMLMTDNSDSLRASSKEGANPPQLVLTVDSARVFLPLVHKTN